MLKICISAEIVNVDIINTMMLNKNPVMKYLKKVVSFMWFEIQ